MQKIVVVLFTYNEKDNLEHTVKQILDQKKNLTDYDIEIVISDSHSPDGTGKIAEQLSKQNKKIHYLDVGPGIGVGIIEGHLYSIKHLNPDIMAQIDADGQVGIEVLPRMVKAIEEGYSLVLGSRFVKGGKNNLALSRRIFSLGASWVNRILIGPWDIQEVTNSARAFTPALFRRINIDRLPWREQSFIIQPAFLHEAILAGAKYKEVPLVFKDRAEGYSKNKTFAYTFDVFAYSLEAMFHRIGIQIPVFKIMRKSKTIFKFGMVGFAGTLVDFIFYKLFIWIFALTPAWSKGYSTEVAIVNNFILNNSWTFRHRKVSTSVWQRFLLFNVVSLGGLAIAVVIVKVLHDTFGDGFIPVFGRNVAFNNFYFFATIPPVMIWNFVVNHYITWRHKNEEKDPIIVS